MPALPCQFGVKVISPQGCWAMGAQLSQKAMKPGPLAIHKVLRPIVPNPGVQCDSVQDSQAG